MRHLISSESESCVHCCRVSDRVASLRAWECATPCLQPLALGGRCLPDGRRGAATKGRRRNATRWGGRRQIDVLPQCSDEELAVKCRLRSTAAALRYRERPGSTWATSSSPCRAGIGEAKCCTERYCASSSVFALCLDVRHVLGAQLSKVICYCHSAERVGQDSGARADCHAIALAFASAQRLRQRHGPTTDERRGLVHKGERCSRP